MRDQRDVTASGQAAGHVVAPRAFVLAGAAVPMEDNDCGVFSGCPRCEDVHGELLAATLEDLVALDDLVGRLRSHAHDQNRQQAQQGEMARQTLAYAPAGVWIDREPLCC